MAEATVVAPTPPARGMTPFARPGIAATIIAVAACHALAAVACAWVLWNIASATWALEALPRTALGIGSAVGLGANALAFIALMRSWRWARTASFTVNYVTLVLVVIGLFQSLDLASFIDAFAGAFNRAFLPFIGLAICVAWLLFARRLAARMDGSDTANLPPWLPWATLAMRYAGLGVGAILAVAWLWLLDIPLLLRTLGEAFAAAPVLNAALAVAFVVLLWCARAMWSGRMADRFQTSSGALEAQAGWLYLSPNLIGFLLFFAGPLVFSLAISLYEWDGITSPVFVGLGNYAETLGLTFASTGSDLPAGFTEVLGTPFTVIGASDPLFWKSIANIVFFLLLAVPLAVIPALILAALINVGYPGTKAFRTIFFVPAVAGVIGVTLIWKQMLNSTVGFVNWLIAQFNGLVNAVLPGDPLPVPVEIGWLSNPSVALIAVVLVFAWSQFGFNTVLFTAGMQGISQELYEAAELDGAGAWRRFTNITLPSLRATTFFVVASTVILALQLFDIVYALNQPNPVGFPDNATLTPVVYLYQLGFQQDAFGQASAVAWVLFVLIFGLTLLQFRRQRRVAEGT